MGKCIIYQSEKLGEMHIPTGSHEDRLIIIGADHKGMGYKREIVKELKGKYDILDIGTHSDEECDYHSISDRIGREISKSPVDRAGVGICGSGRGILTLAGKHRRVYGERCMNPKEAETSRRHNNTNLLCIGAECMDLDIALETIRSWLTAPFFHTNYLEEEVYFRRFVQMVELEEAIIR